MTFGAIVAFVPNSFLFFFLALIVTRHAHTNAADRHAGQLSVKGQMPLNERALLSKAGVSAHAQRMSCLLAADKEYASCRVSERGRVRWGARCVCREVRGYRMRRRIRHARGPTEGWGRGGQGARGAHAEHDVHVRDAGRVKA